MAADWTKLAGIGGLATGGLGTLLGGIGGLLSSGLSDEEKALIEEQLKNYRYKRKVAQESYDTMTGLEGSMKAGVNMGEIAQLTPMATKAAAPQVANVLRSSAARFGVRSPVTAGSVATTVANATAGQTADLYTQSVMDRWRRLSQLYGQRASMALI